MQIAPRERGYDDHRREEDGTERDEEPVELHKVPEDPVHDGRLRHGSEPETGKIRRQRFGTVFSSSPSLSSSLTHRTGHVKFARISKFHTQNRRTRARV